MVRIKTDQNRDQKKTFRRNHRGGGNDDTKYIIEAILDMKQIQYLPKTSVITNGRFKNYLSSIDAKNMLFLIKGTKFGNIPAVQKLFGGNINNNNIPKIDDQSNPLIQNINLIKPDIQNINDNNYYNQFNKLNKEIIDIDIKLKNIKNDIASSNLLLENFKCVEGLDNIDNNFLTNFIMECSNKVNRDKEWYPIILHQKILDDNFEIEFINHMNKYDIRYNYDYIDPLLKQLIDNDKLKTIFKRRIVNCAYRPKKFISELTSNDIFDTFEESTNCYDDCILYLNDDYRSFLLDESVNMDLADKLKILIYCEHRIYQFSKYIKLEAMRINNKEYSRVKNIFRDLYNKYIDNTALVNANNRNKENNEKKLIELENNKKQLMAKQPKAKQPIAKQPIAQQPIAKQPIAQQPIAQQPIAQQPIAKQPLAKQPLAQQPLAKQPLAKQPIVGQAQVGQAQVGGETTSESLMKQNILSQILQVISSDPDSETNTIDSINEQLNIDNKPNIGNRNPLNISRNNPNMNQPDMNQPRMNQPGMNQPRMNQPGMNQPGMNQPKQAFGMDKQGMNQPRMNQPGMNQPKQAFGMDKQGLNQPGMNQPGIDKPKPVFGMDKQGMNQPKPVFGMDKQGMNQPKPVLGMDKQGMNQQVINKPAFGMNKPGMDKPGMDKPAFGMNKPAMDKPAFGMNKQGMNKPAFGMDKPGMDKQVMNKQGMDKPAFGMDKPGMGKPAFGMDKPAFGMDKPGMDKQGMDKQGMDKQGMDKPAFGMNKPVFGMDKQEIDKPSFGMQKRDINMDKKSKNNMDILLGDKSLKKEYNSDPLKKNNNIQSDGNEIYVPNCTAISNDILNNRIKQKNYLYLSPKCNKQILNALINS